MQCISSVNINDSILAAVLFSLQCIAKMALYEVLKQHRLK